MTTLFGPLIFLFIIYSQENMFRQSVCVFLLGGAGSGLWWWVKGLEVYPLDKSAFLFYSYILKLHFIK